MPARALLLVIGALASDGQCYFTGVQLYVRDLDFVDQGRAEMVEYLRGLGPNTTQRLGVAWGSMLDDAGFGEQEVVLRFELHGTAYAFGFAESA